MKTFLILIAGLLLSAALQAQELVVDPVTSGAMLANSAVINSQLNTTNNKLTAIQTAQLAVTGQLTIVNNLQNKIYTGLSEVASVINNLYSVKDIAETGSDIVTDVQKAVQTARGNPVLLLFAQQGAQDFEKRAVALATDVSAFVLKGGSDNLMDSSERSKLLNHIVTEMHVLRGLAYGMQRAMYWAQLRSIWASLNPWATWQNEDIRIANSVVSEAKYLHR
ncbi:hypothetical protein [Mucilaginibacter sp. KACC 22063]|uniref:hypothetical protein n=1 Tax=Mucilaginibacter sp. KACC 22063 TaxID=3025666 RepID=UPI002365E6E3|nr:hypothetical protein [Mucilaginibacter sp. KACC 22063]WDF55882.1 hypothetical protein PQ461_02250 [Mucilaginibacter sp. KACC 22063]